MTYIVESDVLSVKYFVYMDKSTFRVDLKDIKGVLVCAHASKRVDNIPLVIIII